MFTTPGPMKTQPALAPNAALVPPGGFSSTFLKQWLRACARLVPRSPAFYILLALIPILANLGQSFAASLRPVQVVTGGREMNLWTRQPTVGRLFQEAGLSVEQGDLVLPALDQPLPADGRIVVRPAQPVVIDADGDRLVRRTLGPTIEAVLAENGIILKPQDRLSLNGRRVDLKSSLPRPGTDTSQPAIPANEVLPAHISIQRAVPITLVEDGTSSTLFTTEKTLGEALSQAGVQIYVADDVWPDLGEQATSGRSVFIRRSIPATIRIDNRLIRTRTQAQTVAGLLAQEGLELLGKDYSVPPPSDPVRAGTSVAIIRVHEDVYTENLSIPFRDLILPDPELELDQKRVQQGVAGVRKRTWKDIFENGKILSHTLQRDWVDRAPVDHVNYYGTKIVDHPLNLSGGQTVYYWRVIRMLATSYSAASSGKNIDHPQYGITYTGIRSGRGVVAVDPRVIPLNSKVYVPGYGMGLAADTGGGIIGRRIDLGYDDEDLQSWYEWVDIYLLSPAPPRSQIDVHLLDTLAKPTSDSR